MVSAEAESFIEKIRGSGRETTAETYFYAFKCFEEFYGGSIGRFVDEVKEDRLRPRGERRHVEIEVLNRFGEWLKERGCLQSTFETYCAAIQAFAKIEDGVDISLKLVRRIQARQVNTKYPWSNADEVDRFVSYLRNPLYKSIAVSIFQSGLSIIDLLQLRYSDIKAEFEHGVTPLCLRIFRQKTSVRFLTFIGTWGVLQLREYFDAYGKPRSNEPLYALGACGNPKHMKRLVEMHFRSAAKRFLKKEKGLIIHKNCRNPLSPHSLRAAFNTLLADAKMDVWAREYLMGHKLPDHILAYISRSDEAWRQLYKQHELALTPTRLKHLIQRY
ncbi:MAG: site-specific integrase [Candidatus Bathyarchaeia archaeon]